MIKKLAFALSVTTICANIHPTSAYPRSSAINLDDNDGVKVNRVLRVKRLIEQPGIKQLKKRTDAERIKARKRIIQNKRMSKPERVVGRLFVRIAKRMTFIERIKSRQAIRMAKTIKEKLEALIAKSRLNVKGSVDKGEQSPTPPKLESVRLVPAQRLPIPLLNEDVALSKPSAVMPNVNPGLDLGLSQHLKETPKQVLDNNREEPHTFKLSKPNNSILSHIMPEEFIAKHPSVLALTLPKVEVSKAPNIASSGDLDTHQPLISRAALPESLTDLQKNTVMVEEPSIQVNRMADIPILAQLETPSDTDISPQLLGINKVSSAAQYVEKKEEFLDAPVEAIKAALLSVENGISQVKEILQDSKSVLTEKIAEVVPEFLQGLAAPENTAVIVQKEPIVENQIQDVQPKPVAVHDEAVVQNLIQDAQLEPIVVHEEPVVENLIQDVQLEPIVHEEPVVENPNQKVQSETKVYEESKNEIKDKVNYLKDEFSKISVVLSDSLKKLNEFKEASEEKPIKDVQTETITPEETPQENLSEPNHSDADLFDTQIESLSSSLIGEKRTLDSLTKWIQKTGFSLYYSPKYDSDELKIQKHTAEYLINSLENIKASFASLESDIRNDHESTPEDLIMKRARLESLKDIFNNITDKAYDQQSRITFNPSPILTEEDTSSDSEEDTLSDTEDDVFTSEQTPSVTSEMTLDLEQEVAQTIIQSVSLDADVFDTLVTNVESKVEDLTNGLKKIREESYNGYFPNYYGKKYSIIALEDQKQIVENLWNGSENLMETFESLESHVKNIDGFEQENLIEARKTVKNLKDTFLTLSGDLAWVKVTIDSLEPETDTPIEVTEQEVGNTPSLISVESSLKSEPLESTKEEMSSHQSGFLSEPQIKSGDLSTSQPLSGSAFQAIKICGKVFGETPLTGSISPWASSTSGVYTLKICGKEITYDSKDKDKGSSEILSSAVNTNKVLLDSGSSSIKEEKKIEPSALESSIILSQKLEELGAQVDLLLNIGEATDSSDFESDKRLIMSSSIGLRSKLEGKYLSDVPSAENFIEELNLLKSSIQHYTPPTEEAVAERGETAVTTWMGYVTFWAGKILDKLKLS